MIKPLLAVCLLSTAVQAQYKPPVLTKYTMPRTGHVRMFAEDDLRLVIGDQAFSEFRKSGMDLNRWITERNAESAVLTMAEVVSFVLAGLAVGYGLYAFPYGGGDSGLPVAALGSGVLLGGAGAALIYADLQDYGVIKHPELELNPDGSALPTRAARGLSLAFAF